LLLLSSRRHYELGLVAMCFFNELMLGCQLYELQLPPAAGQLTNKLRSASVDVELVIMAVFDFFVLVGVWTNLLTTYRLLKIYYLL
jgi:hypothetical protein